MSLNPQDDIGDKAEPPAPVTDRNGPDRNGPEDPVWDPSLLPGRPPRPAAHVRFELELALAYKERYQHRAAADRWVQMMRDDNEADIDRLQAELDLATDRESASPSNHGDARGTAPGLGAAGEGTVEVEQQVEEVWWPRRSQGRSGPEDDIGL
ncbi:MAG: hypothetical protein M3083_08700 [Actinomycetota bacterium]|nr:hypothetical protein [Actinomycetota bacterium]